MSQEREDQRHAPPPPSHHAVNNRQGVYEPEFQGLQPLPSEMIEVEMQSEANVSQVFDSKGRKSKSVVKSMMQSLRNHAYSTKAFKKLSKSVSARSRKTYLPMSRTEQVEVPEREDRAGSWDDGIVDAWATNSSNPPKHAGDAFWGIEIEDESICERLPDYFALHIYWSKKSGTSFVLQMMSAGLPSSQLPLGVSLPPQPMIYKYFDHVTQSLSRQELILTNSGSDWRVYIHCTNYISINFAIVSHARLIRNIDR